MNHTAKNFFRFAGVVIGLGAAAWALRDKLLPAPEIHDEPPPRFREVGTAADAPESPDAPVGADDLTSIKGIGPVTAERLTEADITSFEALAAAGADTISEIAGTSEAVATRWIEAADTSG